MRLRFLGLIACSLLSGYSAAQVSNQPAAGILAGLVFPTDQPIAFVQRQQSPLMRTVTEQSGTMAKTQTGLYMHVTHPREEQRTIEHGRVTLKLQRVDRRTRLTRNISRQTQLQIDKPAHMVLLALEALLSGKQTFLYDNFEITANQSGRNWVLELIPKNPAIGAKLARLSLTGCGTQLASFRSESGADAASNWMEVLLPQIDCQADLAQQ